VLDDFREGVAFVAEHALDPARVLVKALFVERLADA
jgi:hypothetical protein